MPAAASPMVYRGAVLLLWAMVVLNSVICRGLFWDGASYLAIVLDTHGVRDYYPERQHVAWATQGPLLPLIWAGLRDTKLFAIAYSALLFAWPAGLYHLALARARHDATMLLAILTALVAIYLPTSFFIVGEYNVTYAAVLAAAVIALTSGDRLRRDGLRRDGALLLGLGLLCMASYEAMIHLGPILAFLILWAGRRADVAKDDVARLLWRLAALAFFSGALVAGAAIVEYWGHDYFTRVRAASFDFWQNLQFVVPFAGLGLFALVSLLRPAWLAGRAPLVLLGALAVAIAATPWLRLINPGTILFPPSHYIARTAAGWLTAGLVLALWINAAWQRGAPRLLVELRRRDVAGPLCTAMLVVLFASAVPDLALSRLWVGYLDWFAAQGREHKGIVSANRLPMTDWPQRLFAQDWTYPALSALLRRAPDDGVVVMDKDYKTNPPFEPSCGTVPRLDGFAWR